MQYAQWLLPYVRCLNGDTDLKHPDRGIPSKLPLRIPTIPLFRSAPFDSFERELRYTIVILFAGT